MSGNLKLCIRLPPDWHNVSEYNVDTTPNNIEHSLFYYSHPACSPPPSPPSHSETALAGTPMRTVPKKTYESPAILSPAAHCIGHAILALYRSHPNDASSTVCHHPLYRPLTMHINAVPLAMHRWTDVGTSRTYRNVMKKDREKGGQREKKR